MGNTAYTSTDYAILLDEDNLVLQGTADIDGMGNARNNQIYGNSGNNVLNGGLGLDLLVGGAGNDTYVVETPAPHTQADVVVENANEGHDTVLADYHYALTPNLEDLVLTGTSDWQAYGNELDNRLDGNSGNNLLNGGTGADIMAGHDGNDTYFVDNPGDQVIEQADEGNDAVFSTINYTLTDNVETLVLKDAPNGVGFQELGIGNDGDNKIYGNTVANDLQGLDGNDFLFGDAGDDTLFGGNGNDILNGGAGRDDLWGGDGNDLFRFVAADGRNGQTDTVEDFQHGDKLQFFGYGSAAQGAELEQLGESDNYRVVLGNDATFDAANNQIITIADGGHLQAGVDYFFFA
jgi:trimeric autotransporter adhesin